VGFFFVTITKNPTKFQIGIDWAKNEKNEVQNTPYYDVCEGEDEVRQCNKKPTSRYVLVRLVNK